MLALAALSASVLAICWFIALVLFLLAAFNVKSRVGLVALGLAILAFTQCWAALARA